MNFQVDSFCEVGSVRRTNEDTLAYGSVKALNVFWMLVADGMGGHNAGEVASGLLKKHTQMQFDLLKVLPEKGWKDWMKQLLNQANSTIFATAENNSGYQGMGTTGVLLVLDEKQIYIAWVGDSRAYLMRNQSLLQLTQDHSMIQYLLNKGAISEADAKRSNTKHLLARAIGVKNTVAVDFVSQNLLSDDSLLLTTDGLHDYLKPEQITKHLKPYLQDSSSELWQAVKGQMIKQAIEQKSKDNLTLGLITVKK